MENTEMFVTSAQEEPRSGFKNFATVGMFWLLVAILGATVFFHDGLEALLAAWQLPEYSHGPLIPVLSGLLFLRQLKDVPINYGAVNDRWVGVGVVCAAVAFALLGKLANISDIVAYGLILWVGGMLLISFGWRVGRHFWPPVLHLVYMLPLPDTIYYKLSTWLQLISSEFGVWLLRLLSVPVFLEGNIIDLGVYKLHVAEACSGLRYLFPILSFSYIFAVLYKGPLWHKAVLLISAAPITVAMNSIRIAIAGYIVNNYGLEWVDGFSHFFEGWVIFLACIIILFALARLMLFLQPVKMSLTDALDLETDGLLTQVLRLRFIQASPAMVVTAILMVGASLAWQFNPTRDNVVPQRESFILFPRAVGDWQQSRPADVLEPSVIASLAADDYHSISLRHPDSDAEVGLFMAWYDDQSQGGVHSPEVCLPGGGWEIAWLERLNVTRQFGADHPFEMNQAIIQKGEVRMMVFYWFQQRHRRIAWDMEAKFWLMVDGVSTGRTDGALIRLTTRIMSDESDEEARVRLNSVLGNLLPTLPRFIPEI